MEDSGNLKRRREDESSGELDSSAPVAEVCLLEAKRLRADDLFIDILDDDADDAGEQELASVMKSLEEEIGLPSPSSPPATSSQEEVLVVEQPDLGYLFEASDDELGLPPSVPSSSEEAVEAVASPEVAETVDGVGFGQIWGFDDEIQGFDGFEFGILPPDEGMADAAAAVAEDGVVFDGGLFEYADVLYGPSDLTDPSWRSESLPAV